MLSNLIFFSFQSIFISLGFMTLFTLFISYFYDPGNEPILLITFCLNIFVIFLINIFKNFKEVNNLRFIYITLICWILIIVIGSIPLFELLKNKTFNEILFLVTSSVTTTGFIFSDYSSNSITLSIWLSNLQIIGALYTILSFVIYYSFFLNKYNKLIIINKKSVVLLQVFFFIYLMLFTFCLNFSYYNFIDSYSLSSAILSSGGITNNNSVFIRNNSNYYLLSFLIILSLLYLPFFLLGMSKKALKGSYKKILKRSLGLMLILGFLIFLFMVTASMSFIENLYLVLSLITTTGLLPTILENNILLNEYNNYILFFLLLTCVGTFSGTSNGGLKINRLTLIFINIKEEFNKFLFQYKVKGVDIIKKGVSQNELNSFYSLLGLGIIVVLLSTLIINISGLSIESAFFYSMAALTNSGDGFIKLSTIKESLVPDFYFVLNILMICGRFETIGYLLLFKKIFIKY
jgi:trk system potassium uptake protein